MKTLHQETEMRTEMATFFMCFRNSALYGELNRGVTITHTRRFVYFYESHFVQTQTVVPLIRHNVKLARLSFKFLSQFDKYR